MLTTVIVDILTAHGVVPDGNSYIRARVPAPRTSGTSQIVPGKRPVPLVNGRASLALETRTGGSVWVFELVVPGYTREVALLVPNVGVVKYETLEEQINPELTDGYAPEYVYRARAAAMAAELDAEATALDRAAVASDRDAVERRADEVLAPRVEAYYDPANPHIVIFVPGVAVKPDPLNPEKYLQIGVTQ